MSRSSPVFVAWLTMSYVCVAAGQTALWWSGETEYAQPCLTGSTSYAFSSTDPLTAAGISDTVKQVLSAPTARYHLIIGDSGKVYGCGNVWGNLNGPYEIMPSMPDQYSLLATNIRYIDGNGDVMYIDKTNTWPGVAYTGSTVAAGWSPGGALQSGEKWAVLMRGQAYGVTSQGRFADLQHGSYYQISSYFDNSDADHTFGGVLGEGGHHATGLAVTASNRVWSLAAENCGATTAEGLMPDFAGSDTITKIVHLGGSAPRNHGILTAGGRVYYCNRSASGPSEVTGHWTTGTATQIWGGTWADVTLFVLANGELWAFGTNNYGALGEGNTGSHSWHKVPTMVGKTVSSVSVAAKSSFIVTGGCPTGTQLASGSCVACSPGYISPFGDPCTPCPAGSYQSASGQGSCLSCPLSQYQDETGQSSCKGCPAGTFGNSGGMTACIPCAAATYQDETGQSSCKNCPRGTYADVTGLSLCKRCPLNTFNAFENQVVCQDCPLSSTTEGTGSDSVAFCDCASGYYGTPTSPNPTECKICPTGTKCERGADYPSSEPGKWLDPEIDAQAVLECQPVSACPGDNTCGEGYEDEGCQSCQAGYFRNGSLCQKCTVDALPDWALYTIIAILLPVMIVGLCIAVAAFVIVGLVSKKANKLLKIQRFLFKIVGRFSSIGSSYIKMIQYVGFGFSAPFNISVPAATSLISFTKVINLNLDSTLQLECRFGSDRTGAEVTYAVKATILILLLLAIYAAIAILLAAFVLVVIRKNVTVTKIFPCPVKRLHIMIPKIISRLLSFLAMFYPTFVATAVLPHVCYEQSSGVLKLMSQPDLECTHSNGAWHTMAIYSYIIMGLAVLFIPLIYVVIIVGKLALGNTRHVAVYEALFGVVWAPYKKHLFFWELWMCIQKCALAGCYVFTQVGRIDQAYIMILIALGLLSVHVLFQPYKDPEGSGNLDNRVETVILLVLTSILVCLLALDSAESQGASDLALVLVQTALLASFAYAFSFPTLGVLYTMRTSFCPCLFAKAKSLESAEQFQRLAETNDQPLQETSPFAEGKPVSTSPPPTVAIAGPAVNVEILSEKEVSSAAEPAKPDAHAAASPVTITVKTSAPATASAPPAIAPPASAPPTLPAPKPAAPPARKPAPVPRPASRAPTHQVPK